MKPLNFIKCRLMGRAQKATTLNFSSFVLALALILAALSSCKKSTTVIKTEETVGDPVIAFSWVGEQNAPAQITFTNSTLNATAFQWNFGNGQTSNKMIPDAVSYQTAGTYDVTLTAMNGSKKMLLKKTIVISPNADPIAHFAYSFKNQRSYAPATIQLTNESVNADSYEWDVNGVQHSVKTPPDVTFNQAGNYTVKLVAIKGTKRSAVFEETVTVGANPDPVAKFVLPYHPYPYTAGEEIQLVNQSTNSDSYYWTFGTGGPAPSTDEHPLVKFANPGTYTITLVAKKGNASSTPRSINLKIN